MKTSLQLEGLKYDQKRMAEGEVGYDRNVVNDRELAGARETRLTRFQNLTSSRP